MFLFFLLLRLFSFYWVALSGLNIGGGVGLCLVFLLLVLLYLLVVSGGLLFSERKPSRSEFGRMGSCWGRGSWEEWSGGEKLVKMDGMREESMFYFKK